MQNQNCGENPQFYRQWMVWDSQNGLYAKKFFYKDKEFYQLGFQLGVLALKIQESVPLYIWLEYLVFNLVCNIMLVQLLTKEILHIIVHEMLNV